MNEWEPILREEFAAENDSFLLRLRCELVWDKAAFNRLVAAMEQCAIAYQRQEKIDRWVAEGFWFVEQFVPADSGHTNFPLPHGKAYYERAYKRLKDLSYWLFTGESPYQTDRPLELL